MRIGLVDVDGHNFPNLCLMKLSAWHKAKGEAWQEIQQQTHDAFLYGKPHWSTTSAFLKEQRAC